jgi:hypothetical protein
MVFLWFLDKPPRSIFFQTYLQDSPGEKNLDNMCFFGTTKNDLDAHPRYINGNMVGLIYGYIW